MVAGGLRAAAAHGAGSVLTPPGSGDPPATACGRRQTSGARPGRWRCRRPRRGRGGLPGGCFPLSRLAGPGLRMGRRPRGGEPGEASPASAPRQPRSAAGPLVSPDVACRLQAAPPAPTPTRHALPRAAASAPTTATSEAAVRIRRHGLCFGATTRRSSSSSSSSNRLSRPSPSLPVLSSSSRAAFPHRSRSSRHSPRLGKLASDAAASQPVSAPARSWGTAAASSIASVRWPSSSRGSSPSPGGDPSSGRSRNGVGTRPYREVGQVGRVDREPGSADALHQPPEPERQPRRRPQVPAAASPAIARPASPGWGAAPGTSDRRAGRSRGSRTPRHSRGARQRSTASASASSGQRSVTNTNRTCAARPWRVSSPSTGPNGKRAQRALADHVAAAHHGGRGCGRGCHPLTVRRAGVTPKDATCAESVSDELARRTGGRSSSSPSRPAARPARPPGGVDARLDPRLGDQQRHQEGQRRDQDDVRRVGRRERDRHPARRRRPRRARTAGRRAAASLL